MYVCCVFRKLHCFPWHRGGKPGHPIQLKHFPKRGTGGVCHHFSGVFAAVEAASQVMGLRCEMAPNRVHAHIAGEKNCV